MNHLRTCLALSVAAITSASCGSPTSPSRSFTLVGAGTCASADATATILEFHLSLDGSEEGSLTPTVFATPQSQIHLDTLNAEHGHGHHTLVLRVSNQTRSPTMYRTTGITMTLLDTTADPFHGVLVGTTQLADQAVSLNTGDAITIGFDI